MVLCAGSVVRSRGGLIRFYVDGMIGPTNCSPCSVPATLHDSRQRSAVRALYGSLMGMKAQYDFAELEAVAIDERSREIRV